MTISFCYMQHSHEYELDFSELQKLSAFRIKTKTKKITALQNRILQFIGDNYIISGADIYKKFSFKKKAIDYSNANKYLRSLNGLGLIEIDKERTEDRIRNKNREKYYKLSKHGIYTLIVSNENLPFNIVKNVIMNHKDHILFGFFVFPYIESETLLKITDSIIFSRIFSYLHECCKRIDELIRAIRHTYNQKNGYLTDQLFIWDNVPKVEYDTERLRAFLKARFKWDWLEKAQFKKTPGGRGIEVSYEMKSILINMDSYSTKAILRFRGKILYEFIIRQGIDIQIVDIPTDSRVVVQHVLIFLIFCQARVVELIFSILSQYGARSAAVQYLSEDEKFLKALARAKRGFEKRYKFFTKKECN